MVFFHGANYFSHSQYFLVAYSCFWWVDALWAPQASTPLHPTSIQFDISIDVIFVMILNAVWLQKNYTAALFTPGFSQGPIPGYLQHQFMSTQAELRSQQL